MHRPFYRRYNLMEALMKNVMLIIIFIFFSTILNAYETSDIDKITSKIASKLSEINSISYILTHNFQTTKRGGGIDSAIDTSRYDIKKMDNRFYKKITTMSSPEKHISIFTPDYLVGINTSKKIIKLLSPQLIPSKDYDGLFQGYDVGKFLDASHDFESFKLYVTIAKSNFDLVETFYNGIPCIKLMYEYYYTGQLQGGAKNSKAIVNFIFDSNTFLLYEQHLKKIDYDEDESNILSFVEIVYAYKYLQINEGFPPEYFDYKHLLGLGYTLNVEK
jgi:hypothetical protein